MGLLFISALYKMCQKSFCGFMKTAGSVENLGCRCENSKKYPGVKKRKKID